MNLSTHNTRSAVLATQAYTSRDIRDKELAALWADMHRMNSQLKAALHRVTRLEAYVEQQEDKISHLEAALGIMQLMDSAGSDNMSDEK